MKKAVAFAPGHISGFFQPVIDSQDNKKTGSRGAGVCISHGATAEVNITEQDNQLIKIRVNGKTGAFPVTLHAITTLVKNKKLRVDVDISLDLPIGQGFGMSAASALSASLATASLLHKPRLTAIQAAHHAEVKNHTGLGDVFPSAIGGFEIRKKPGVPPFGQIHQIKEQHSLLLGLFPGGMSTESILTNKEKVKHITKLGKYCTDQVLQSASVKSIMNYSYYFTQKSGLAPKKISDALKKINEKNLGSMCMLGHSLFIIQKNDTLKKLLATQVKIIKTTVDLNGARLIHTSV
jgi:pantoate kinase